MTALYIVLLVLFGVLFLVAELVLLPGVSLGAILALGSYGAAGYMAWTEYGVVGCGIVVAVIITLSVITTIISLRAKTWQGLSLKEEIRSSSMPRPEEEISVGDRGTTLSRLSPMGKVEIAGRIYEAKSYDSYVDPRTEIEVVGFENFNVIVRTLK